MVRVAMRGISRWVFFLIRQVKVILQVVAPHVVLSLGATLEDQGYMVRVSTKNCDLWPGPTPEVRHLRTSRHSAHAQSQV